LPRDEVDDRLDVLERRLQDALELLRETRRTEQTATRWLSASAKFGGLLSAQRDALGEVRQAMIGGARTAVLAYLRQRVGQAVPAGALEGVSGIEEWTRRLRELRALGWEIESLGSGPTRSYRLRVDHLNENVVNDDQLIDLIKSHLPKERLIEYLVNVAPWPVPACRLEQVARSATWQDDLQELIDDGWMIHSHDDDRAIAPGFYRLTRLED
jgi:hypothetical protein